MMYHINDGYKNEYYPLFQYKNLIYKIINCDNITLINKEFFLLYMLNTYDTNNIDIINDKSINIIFENLKYNINILEKNDHSNLNNIILYKILNLSVLPISFMFECIKIMISSTSASAETAKIVNNFFIFKKNYCLDYFR